MEQQRLDVIVIGSVNMDFVAVANRLPEKGETVIGQSFRASPGGKGANQVVAAARLGARTALIGCVGDDEIGVALRKSLVGNNVDCRGVGVAPGHASGVAMIVVDAAGANTIVVTPGGNGQVSTDAIDAAADWIASASVVTLQLEIPLEVTAFAAKAARRMGKIVVLNPAPAHELPDDLLACVDYLVPNESEASALTGIHVDSPQSAADAAKLLRQRGVANVLVTMGERGVLCATSSGAMHYPAKAVQPVDTTAAGDTFIGALSCALATGAALETAIAFGQSAAAISVTRHGVQESIPFLHELGGDAPASAPFTA